MAKCENCEVRTAGWDCLLNENTCGESRQLFRELQGKKDDEDKKEEK